MAYIGPGKVEVQSIDYPKLELQDGPGVNPDNVGRKCNARRDLEGGRDEHLRQRPAHGARPHDRTARTSILGHEITGEVVETGPDVEFIKEGDLCSVPFNIACGRCRMCKEGKTGVCLNVNPARPGSAYGYVDMGGWVGGQAEYVMVPYADWNLLKFPDKDQAMEKILDLTMLSDIFPTGFHGCVTAGVKPGRPSTSRAPARSASPPPRGAQLLGAAVVIVGDMNPSGSSRRRSFGCETVDVSKGAPEDQIEQIARRAGGGLRRSTRSASRPGATARDAGRRRRPRC